MSSDRDFSVLVGRIEKALQQAQKMKLDVLAHILQMALLEVVSHCSDEHPLASQPIRRGQRRPH